MTTEGNKRVHVENTTSRIKSKKARMDKANTSGFVEVKSAHSRKIIWYYAKNLNNFENYISFLANVKPELVELLRIIVSVNPIKFNLKLESTYNQPHVENSSQNMSFKTAAREIFLDSDLDLLIEQAFAKLLHEEEIYVAKDSGYVLESIDGLLLTVYKYTPMGNISNIGLPVINFDNGRDDVNDNPCSSTTLNIDQQKETTDQCENHSDIFNILSFIILLQKGGGDDQSTEQRSTLF